MRRSIPLLALLAFETTSPAFSQSRPDQEAQQVINPIVQPFEVDGRSYGCEISFHIARGPRPGEWTDAIGATLSVITPSDKYWVAALKIGYQPASARVVPPTSSALQYIGDNNASDLVRSQGPDEYGYMILTFLPGTKTRSAFAQLSETGSLEIAVAVAGGPNNIFRLNLNEYPVVKDQWVSCLQSYPIFAGEWPALEQQP